MERFPLVSVIVPTYNRSSFLMESLESVKNQTYQNWECIVVDDGSEDDTRDVVEKLVKSDDRFKFYYRPANYAKGACGSRNFGFIKSSGDFIQYLDDDDLLSDNKIELQINNLLECKVENVITTCDWDVFWQGKALEVKSIFDEEEIILPSNYLCKIKEKESFLPCHSFLIPRTLIESAGLWNTNLLINDDAEFVLRILLNSRGLIDIKGCYVLYRMHADKRISSRYTSITIESLLHGYQLMHKELKKYSIENREFFQWKLRRMLIAFWNTERKIFLENAEFFKTNGLNLRWVYFYLAKHRIYKTVYPIYKKLLLTSN